MHIAIAIVIILLIWYVGIWREWRQYHSTMLFFGFMALEYNLIVQTNNHFLWKTIPDPYFTRIPLISLYAFIIFPGTALLYLSKFPRKLYKQILYVLGWSIIYFIIEYILYFFHRIAYFNGYYLWHSFVFDIVLFIGLIFHHRKPVFAYIVFLIVTILGIYGYKIPV